MTFAILSDIHAHTWTQFGHMMPDGVNNRLRIILDEMERAADELVLAGGSEMIIAGDLFHTRGVMDPEVLNPTRQTFDRILAKGIDVIAIPGNHDLKSRDTNELSSAIQNLAQIGPVGGSFTVINEPKVIGSRAFAPWRDKKEDLFADIEAITKATAVKDIDLFIHAGIAGVLTGPTSIGEITATELTAFGFRRVFAGHYHNHKALGGGVYSIGATTHHNWGDVGTRAGFLLATETALTFKDTHAPKFVDISGLDEEEMALVAPNNYVRFRGPAMTNEQIKEFRDALSKMGAVGISIEVPRATAALRSTKTTPGLSLKQSISKFISTATVPAHISKEEVEKRALDLLDLSQAVVEES